MKLRTVSGLLILIIVMIDPFKGNMRLFKRNVYAIENL